MLKKYWFYRVRWETSEKTIEVSGTFSSGLFGTSKAARAFVHNKVYKDAGKSDFLLLNLNRF